MIRLKQVGAYDVRIADPSVGYEHVMPGKHPDSIWEPLSAERMRKHPLDLWEDCRSVVLFALACPPSTNNTYFGPHAPWEGNRDMGPVPKSVQSDRFAMDRLARVLISQITLRGMQLLEQRGHGFRARYSSFGVPGLKLSAYEAGIGVYGRAGFIIHPVLGSRIRLGGLLTDALLEPDGRLEGFNPCENCDRCIRNCPARAIDPNKDYPYSYDRAKCMEKRSEIAKQGFYCHNCYAVCPAGKIPDGDLLRVSEVESFYGPHRRSS